MTDPKEQIKRYDEMIARGVIDDPEDFMLDWLMDAIEALRSLTERNDLLTALENAGVGYWDGYDVARGSLHERT